MKSLLGVAYAGIAFVEAWLTGRTDVVTDVRVVLARTREPGAALRGGACATARVGEPVAALPGMRPARRRADGDWRRAPGSGGRSATGARKRRELAESGEVEPTLEALRLLDELARRPASPVRLRDLGVTAIRVGRRSTCANRPGSPTGSGTSRCSWSRA